MRKTFDAELQELNYEMIDMAAAAGGNVEGSQDNQTVRIGDVTVIGDSNLAAGVPASASTLFARNVFNFLNAMYNPETQNITFDFADELVAKTCICKDGQLTGALK